MPLPCARCWETQKARWVGLSQQGRQGRGRQAGEQAAELLRMESTKGDTDGMFRKQAGSSSVKRRLKTGPTRSKSEVK